MRKTHGLPLYSPRRGRPIPRKRHDPLHRIRRSLPRPPPGTQLLRQHLLPQQRHLRTPSAQQRHPSHLKNPAERRLFRIRSRNMRHLHRRPAGSHHHHCTVQTQPPTTSQRSLHIDRQLYHKRRPHRQPTTEALKSLQHAILVDKR